MRWGGDLGQRWWSEGGRSAKIALNTQRHLPKNNKNNKNINAISINSNNSKGLYHKHSGYYIYDTFTINNIATHTHEKRK